jgi:hypothetical protein
MPRFRTFSSPFVLALGLVLGFACSLSSGAELNARGRKELQAVERVIQQNFEASNREDVRGVMATMTPVIPQQERFVEELRQFFKDVDCYTRLVSVELVSSEMTDDGLRAIVRVVQETMVGGEEKDLPYSEFRERSVMLPPWPLCEYDMVLYKVRNKWLIYECDGQPREVTREELAARTGAAD